MCVCVCVCVQLLDEYDYCLYLQCFFLFVCFFSMRSQIRFFTLLHNKVKSINQSINTIILIYIYIYILGVARTDPSLGILGPVH